MSEIRDRAKNRWRSILPSLGVDEKFLGRGHGPCPACAGKDRFRFDDKDGMGMFFCNSCGAGDGFRLLELVNGWDFARTAKEVEAIVGKCAEQAPKAAADPADVRKRMNNIWKQSHGLEGCAATRQWWQNRIGFLPTSSDLRGVDELYHAESRRRFPGMIALVRGQDGKPVNMHRTYLTDEGLKAPVSASRMLMPLELPKGSAVRLAPYTDHLGIAEGIETAVAATALTGTPCWAALNAQNLEGWIPPEGVAVTVFGDNDQSFTGASAAYRLARRLFAMGVKVKVEMPGTPGDDWNDVLLFMRENGRIAERLAA